MKARRNGAIVNVSTGSVRTLPPGRSPYITSKTALEGLTRAVAREAGSFNVRCNAVQPGLMDNARLARILSRVSEQTGKSPTEVEAEALSFVSMRSKIQMNEVAAMVEFLCSDAARHVTGQIIAVDGGVEWEA
jgi:NAD(P)-dependent dehydrogenase (short-subunit alcohol dehydrogenase family)